jgi:hypothetical protein
VLRIGWQLRFAVSVLDLGTVHSWGHHLINNNISLFKNRSLFQHSNVHYLAKCIVRMHSHLDFLFVSDKYILHRIFRVSSTKDIHKRSYNKRMNFFHLNKFVWNANDDKDVYRFLENNIVQGVTDSLLGSKLCRVLLVLGL